MIVIEDEQHAELVGQFSSLEHALAELRRLAITPWDQHPNVAPCTGWRTCGRTYAVVEYDDTQSPWKELRRIPVLEVSAAGVNWADGFDGADSTTKS
ncbi:MAG: hypothetical protein AB7U73_07255 [Pirellulales bacterium]